MECRPATHQLKHPATHPNIPYKKLKPLYLSLRYGVGRIRNFFSRHWDAITADCNHNQLYIVGKLLLFPVVFRKTGFIEKVPSKVGGFGAMDFVELFFCAAISRALTIVSSHFLLYLYQ
jgi:hypothetical protein